MQLFQKFVGFYQFNKSENVIHYKQNLFRFWQILWGENSLWIFIILSEDTTQCCPKRIKNTQFFFLNKVSHLNYQNENLTE